MPFKISSSAFENGSSIPAKYTCDGENINPPLKIDGMPKATKSFVIIMDDPDIPDFVKQKMGIEIFDHWIVFNIFPETREIKEDTATLGVQGKNSSGEVGYTGPCPPDGEHRYFFCLYALDSLLDLRDGASRRDIEIAMQGHILDKTELMGKYYKF